MQGTETEWSEVEKQVAEKAFHTAYKRETTALINEICEKVSLIAEIEDVWHLHDYLSAKRHEIDGKYDFDYSTFIFVFARLLKDKWLSVEELSGLAADKISKMSVLSRM
jgi:Photoprotection regulator fluorescence recovery protein